MTLLNFYILTTCFIDRPKRTIDLHHSVEELQQSECTVGVVQSEKMVGGGHYSVAPCIRVCSVFQLLLGCVALAAGPLGNSFIPICYVPFTLLTALGALVCSSGKDFQLIS